MRIHFVAIGGAIMHNLAICLYKKGMKISGSDDIIFDPAKSNLEKYGLLPDRIGFFEENITGDIDAIILGMHAKTDNVELKEAQEMGLKIYSFPEFIYQQSKSKTRVVVAGSHGKTSSTAMIMHVLKLQNLDFDYLVGANLDGFEDNVKISDAPVIILEGDEYLSSPIEMKSKFHFYHPHITMITGIAWDHVNVFPTWESYTSTFREYIESVEPGGKVIYFGGDETLADLSQYARCATASYHTPAYKIENGTTYLLHQNGATALQIFGEHNLQNLEGARMVCNALGIDNDTFYRAISTFKGAARRLEKIDSAKGAFAYKDFAHSPSKLEATIKAVKQQFPEKKLLACMELHTYSSTDPKFLSEFKNSMLPADTAIIYMSDKAFEIKNKQKIEDEVIHKNFNQHDIQVIRTPEKLKTALEKHRFSDTVFLMMTSGNFDGFDLSGFFN